MKKNIKKIWKFFAKISLRLYVRDFSLYVYNNPDFTDLKTRGSHSQFGQDLFVIKTLGEIQNGVFVDIGGNHPINGSNTYLLEQKGWNGIAIEPQEKLRKLWPGLRKAECLNYVVGPENKVINFIEGKDSEHGLSGVEGYNKCHATAQKVSVEQKRLEDILKEKQIDRIDYLSIDVEGYEMKVLESINFTATTIRLISIENDIGFVNIPYIGEKIGAELGNNKLRHFLRDKGYVYIGRVVCDDFFIKN